MTAHFSVAIYLFHERSPSDGNAEFEVCVTLGKSFLSLG